MRENLVRMDVVECVLGLAPNLFYGSPMKLAAGSRTEEMLGFVNEEYVHTCKQPF